MQRQVKILILVLSGVLLALFGNLGVPADDEIPAEAEGQAVYVGSEKCKDCHASLVEAYSGFKRSRNFRVLEMRGRENDQQCLPCHTTGYGRPGGFVSVEKTPHLTNVQCEVCHGPASLHVKAATKAEKKQTLQIPRNLCTQCHIQHGHREL